MLHKASRDVRKKIRELLLRFQSLAEDMLTQNSASLSFFFPRHKDYLLRFFSSFPFTFPYSESFFRCSYFTIIAAISFPLAQYSSILCGQDEHVGGAVSLCTSVIFSVKCDYVTACICDFLHVA